MKLRMNLAVLLLAGAFAQSAFAQTPLLRIIATHLAWQAYDEIAATVKCPTGYFPITYEETAQFYIDQNQVYQRDLVNSNGDTVQRATLSSAAPLMGGGVSLDDYNEEHHAHNSEGMLICLAAGASSDGTLTLVASSTSVARNAVGTVTNFCPADSPVALGGFSSADGIYTSDYGSSPVWGTSAAPVLLSTLPDGQTGPPTGWSSKVFNPDPTSSTTIQAYAICGKSPNLQTFVYSTPVPPSVFSIRPIFATIAPVPDGWTAVGSGFDGGQYALYYSTDVWMDDGNLVDMIPWYPVNSTFLAPICSCVVPYDNGENKATPYDSGTSEVRAFLQRSYGNGPVDGTGRAFAAVLAVPKPSAPATTVPIVEFYNAALDHYFITANPQEISDLDNGVHVGWARTGQSFNGYGIGSSGSTDRRPVCRAYGSPAAGLDTHFYSASPDECLASLQNGSGNDLGTGWVQAASWILEANEVFEMDLPDPLSGACPTGDVPIYRVFNQRKDANHRYTTSTAIRDQMVAKGGIAEGYGPNAVALCGLP